MPSHHRAHHHAPCIGFFLLLLAFLAPASNAAETTDSCLVIPGMKTKVSSVASTHYHDFSNGTRYVTCNHKTGTLFAQCLCKVMESQFDHVCAAGGYPRGHNMGMQHTSGIGIATHNFGVNLVRNPFVMVHSGMSYHSTTNNRGEGWLFLQTPIEKRSQFGVSHAVAKYNSWCLPGKAELNTTNNYQDIIKVAGSAGVCLRVCVLSVLRHSCVG